jgi:hypothetical protein
LRDEANDLALAAKQPLPHPHHKPPNADNGERFLYDYFLEQLELEKSANWKAAMLLGNGQLCACPCDKCCTRRLTCPCSVCCKNGQISGGDPTSEPVHKQLEAFLRASPDVAAKLTRAASFAHSSPTNRESFLAIAALVRNDDLETAAQLAITRHVDLVAIIQQAAPGPRLQHLRMRNRQALNQSIRPHRAHTKTGMQNHVIVV